MEKVAKHLLLLSFVVTLTFGQSFPDDGMENCFVYETQQECNLNQGCSWEQTPVGMFCVVKVMGKLNCLMHMNNQTACESNQCKWRCSEFLCVNSDENTFNCFGLSKEQCKNGCSWTCFAPMCLSAEDDQIFEQNAPFGNSRRLQDKTLKSQLHQTKEFLNRGIKMQD